AGSAQTLPGSSPEKDLEAFRRLFDDPAFRPDMLKFYTTLVIPGTPLYDSWKSGEYEPYDTETGTALMAAMKSLVPEYVRIQRVQRDIPVPQIAAGIMKSNIRELIQERMAEQGRSCRCIRCREVGHQGREMVDLDAIQERLLRYEASGGEEFFISYDYEDALVGYARLRMNGDRQAMLRELKVFGRMAPLGSQGKDWQHRGFGKELVERAEDVARSQGADSLRVISGVGVRRYYRGLGYELQAPYMIKRL
ncbi:MAG: GNAT family N-acetyltransferase, partial [Synergistales bacterium]|nr:GNAT family N-acetyltransferase [Synergistales bacterium]